MKETVQQVLLAKYLYERGLDMLSEPGPYSTGLAVSLFQDSVESLIWTIAKHVDSKPSDKAPFESIWDGIKTGAKNPGHKELPLKAKIIDLNKARVGFKHYGNLPAAVDGARFQIYAHDFLTTACSDFLLIDFTSASMADLIKDQRVLKHIQAAEVALKAQQWKEAIDEAAKAHKFLSRLIDQLIPPVAQGLGELMASLVENREKSKIKEIEESLGVLRNFTVATALHQPVADVVRFKELAPSVILYQDSATVLFPSRNTPNQGDAEFTIRHVTRFALAIEQTLLGVSLATISPLG